MLWFEGTTSLKRGQEYGSIAYFCSVRNIFPQKRSYYSKLHVYHTKTYTFTCKFTRNLPSTKNKNSRIRTPPQKFSKCKQKVSHKHFVLPISSWYQTSYLSLKKLLIKPGKKPNLISKHVSCSVFSFILKHIFTIINYSKIYHVLRNSLKGQCKWRDWRRDRQTDLTWLDCLTETMMTGERKMCNVMFLWLIH